jgi:sortase B
MNEAPMSAAAKAGITAIRLTIKAVDMAILIIVLFFVAADYYAAWESKRAYEWAESRHYEPFSPHSKADPPSFADLQAINPEVLGWLTVYGTHIDYPVAQGSDNLKYVNTSAFGQYSLSGAIFLDARNKRDFSDSPSVIYGHHMEKNAMFGEIGLFLQKDYFDARQYGLIYYGGQDHGLEFFAFLHCDAYDSAIYRVAIRGREEREAYLDLLFNRAIHSRDIKITADDRLVLLSTCSASTTNGRDILAARITDELYEDPFETTEPDKEASAIDSLSGRWAQLPPWAKLAIIILPPLLILFLIIQKRKRQKRSNMGARSR